MWSVPGCSVPVVRLLLSGVGDVGGEQTHIVPGAGDERAAVVGNVKVGDAVDDRPLDVIGGAVLAVVEIDGSTDQDEVVTGRSEQTILRFDDTTYAGKSACRSPSYGWCGAISFLKKTIVVCHGFSETIFQSIAATLFL